MIKPFLKWVGGKTQIIDTIISKYPKEINNYYDVFVGGGSTLFALLQSDIKYNNVYAYDLNKTLINTYINIQTHYQDVFNELVKLFDYYDNKEDKYYEIRSKYNSIDECIEKSAMFIFLNRTCFRGLYRTGPNGFNVPFGHYKKVMKITLEELRKISELIKNVHFECIDFEDSLNKEFNKDDFIYLDPPYYPETSKSFVKYVNDFDKNKHDKLFRMCKELKCKFLMSNSNVDYVKESFKDYQIEMINCKRRINSKNPESTTYEVMILNKLD